MFYKNSLKGNHHHHNYLFEFLRQVQIINLLAGMRVMELEKNNEDYKA